MDIKKVESGTVFTGDKLLAFLAEFVRTTSRDRPGPPIEISSITVTLLERIHPSARIAGGTVIWGPDGLPKEICFKAQVNEGLVNFFVAKDGLVSGMIPRSEIVKSIRL